MKGCTLAEQHKRRVTDLLKATVWHLLSAGEMEDIILDHALARRERGGGGDNTFKAAEEKVLPYKLLKIFKPSLTASVERRSLFIYRNNYDKCKKTSLDTR